MSFNKPIRRVAVVGVGVIGANWAAQYLVRGFARELLKHGAAPDQIRWEQFGRR